MPSMKSARASGELKRSPPSHPIEVIARGAPPTAVKVAATGAKPAITRPDVDFDALDGLRSAACLAVICFHCLLYWGALLDLDAGRKALDASPLLRLAMHGNAGVDVFLVLCGMWAALQLVPALERAAVASRGAAAAGVWPAIKQYYRKRVLRVLPPYLTALLLVAFAIDHSKDADPALRANHDTVFEYCPASLPLNLLLLNNVAGFGGCGVHFWSLAVQLQFYLAFPLALWCLQPSRQGFRRRIARAALATLALGSALRWGAAHAADVRLPLPAYAHPDLGAEGADVAVRYYHTLYFATPARAGNLATGVLLGLILGDAAAVAALRRKRWALSAAAAATVGVAARLVLAPRLYGTLADQAAWPHAKAFAALAYHGSPLYCAVVAAVVLCFGLHATPAAAQAALLLKSRPVRHLAKLSYDIYLLHMAALYWWEAGALPRGVLAEVAAKDPGAGYGAILAGTCCTAYAAAVLHRGAHAVAAAAWRRATARGR